MVVLSFMMTSEIWPGLWLVSKISRQKILFILITFWSKKYRNETITGEKCQLLLPLWKLFPQSQWEVGTWLYKHFGPLLCIEAVSYPSDIQRID